MASNFKCMVKINGNKYSVIINKSNNNSITFNDIYKKILKIDEKLNISYKTHLFEVLDNDFDEYVVITDDKQIINNLSRFRVSQKPTKSTDNHKSSQSKSDSTKAQNSNQSSNKSKNTLKMYSNNSENRDSVINKSMDDLNKNILENINIPKLSAHHIREFEDMKLIILFNMKCFIENRDNTRNWTKIASKMKDKGYDRNLYNAKYCKQLFFNYANIYKQILEYSPNKETASNYFPLFKLFHTMDLKFYFSSNDYKQFVLLREKFDLKHKCSQSMSTTTTSLNDKTRTKTPIIEKPKNNSRVSNESHINRTTVENRAQSQGLENTHSQSLPDFIPLIDSNKIYEKSSVKRSQSQELKDIPKKVKTEFPLIELD